MKLKDRIFNLSDTDVNYPYDGDPLVKTRTKDVYEIRLDPFPAYSHDADLVQYEARQNEQNFPLPFDVFYHNLSHEMLWRVNGCALFNNDPLEGWVALSGKRIPIHPAMTRSLIAHEYGHIVFRWLQHEYTNFLEDYRKVRSDLPKKDLLGPRNWHTTIEEIVVNDFRIIISDRESGFWPHEVTHPYEVIGLRDFWKDLKRKYAK